MLVNCVGAKVLVNCAGGGELLLNGTAAAVELLAMAALDRNILPIVSEVLLNFGLHTDGTTVCCCNCCWSEATSDTRLLLTVLVILLLLLLLLLLCMERFAGICCMLLMVCSLVAVRNRLQSVGVGLLELQSMLLDLLATFLPLDGRRLLFFAVVNVVTVSSC